MTGPAVANILEQIVAEKRREVDALRAQAGRLKQAAAARKQFRKFAPALRRADGLAVIAEIKKASPSAGILRADFDAFDIARQYEAAGAAALSVLTDEKFFHGRVEHLQLIREAVSLPLLRKDFIIDELQIYESAARGADAVLLIVGVLDAVQLADFCQLAEQLRLDALVEVHHELELDRAVAAGARIIGINNRNLRDFSVDLGVTERLAAALAARTGEDRPILVAESGIHSRADVERMRRAGVDAILVGETLLRSKDIAATLRELLA
jgi:indole-3-glycerol phosphate synthase